MSIRALVVGGTSGIGFGMASRLAASASSAAVIISGRSKPENMTPNMEFRPLDASSMRQIKAYTDTLKASQQQEKLDYLIMSQGIMTLSGRTETAEGIDRKMALHYYGRQLLLRELLPVLKEDAKVIVVLDGKLGDPSKLLWDDLDLKTHYGLKAAADHCITMNDSMVQYYAAEQKREGGVNKRHFVHALPGGVDTNIVRHMPIYLKPLSFVATKLLTVSPDTCAKYMLSGTTQQVAEGEQEGRFWGNIDSKGHLIKTKAIWSAEQMKKVADHTWGVIDGALSKPE